MKNLIKAILYFFSGVGLLISLFWLCCKFAWLANITLIVTFAIPVLLLIYAIKKCLDERDERR